MRVKMNRTAAGPDRNLIEGREYTLPDAEAAELVDGGYADEVAEPAPPQTEPAEVESQPEPPAGEPAVQTEEDTNESGDAQAGVGPETDAAAG